jgi:hypothetical protein
MCGCKCVSMAIAYKLLESMHLFFHCQACELTRVAAVGGIRAHVADSCLGFVAASVHNQTNLAAPCNLLLCQAWKCKP